MRRVLAALLLLVLSAPPAAALTARELFSDLSRYNEQGTALIDSLGYNQGRVTIDSVGVRLEVPTTFYFLEQGDANRVLTEAWGNPIGQTKDVVGMIFPAKYTPLDPDNWGAALIFEDDGHVDDSDVGKLDATKLMERMKADVAASNEERRFNGFAEATLIGWAAPPRYDSRRHTLTWAREIAIAGKPETTINYAVRYLGRTGMLSLTFVGRKRQLPEMQAALPVVMSMVEFVPGARYDDFDAKLDKHSTLGLAGLIMGKPPESGFSWGTLLARLVLGTVGVVGIGAALMGWRLRQRRAAAAAAAGKRRI
jgi:uncharacterized membrane-anchored protein